MPTDTRITGFTRDPSLSSEIADLFGGAGANAEQLIELNALRYSGALYEANLHRTDPEGVKEFTRDDVAKASGYESKQILDFAKRGGFITYVFEIEGRVGKDALVIDDNGNLEAESAEANPRRAALQASIESQQTIQRAKEEAARILREAQEEANQQLAEAAQKRREAEEEAAAEAREELEKQREQGTEGDPQQREDSADRVQPAAKRRGGKASTEALS